MGGVLWFREELLTKVITPLSIPQGHLKVDIGRSAFLLEENEGPEGCP